jgi:hypothetical protein
MTTSVYIRCPPHNLNDVLVRTVIGLTGEVLKERRLEDDEEEAFYVYPGQEINILEIEKAVDHVHVPG